MSNAYELRQLKIAVEQARQRVRTAEAEALLSGASGNLKKPTHRKFDPTSASGALELKRRERVGLSEDTTEEPYQFSLPGTCRCCGKPVRLPEEGSIYVLFMMYARGVCGADCLFEVFDSREECIKSLQTIIYEQGTE